MNDKLILKGLSSSYDEQNKKINIIENNKDKIQLLYNNLKEKIDRDEKCNKSLNKQFFFDILKNNWTKDLILIIYNLIIDKYEIFGIDFFSGNKRKRKNSGNDIRLNKWCNWRCCCDENYTETSVCEKLFRELELYEDLEIFPEYVIAFIKESYKRSRICPRFYKVVSERILNKISKKEKINKKDFEFACHEGDNCKHGIHLNFKEKINKNAIYFHDKQLIFDSKLLEAANEKIFSSNIEDLTVKDINDIFEPYKSFIPTECILSNFDLEYNDDDKIKNYSSNSAPVSPNVKRTKRRKIIRSPEKNRHFNPSRKRSLSEGDDYIMDKSLIYNKVKTGTKKLQNSLRFLEENGPIKCATLDITDWYNQDGPLSKTPENCSKKMLGEYSEYMENFINQISKSNDLTESIRANDKTSKYNIDTFLNQLSTSINIDGPVKMTDKTSNSNFKFSPTSTSPYSDSGNHLIIMDVSSSSENSPKTVSVN